ncbi:hypothetical protein HMPREF1024_00714 [Klebsiella sp. 4_1_44FAA]|nr:hypothetical protein HMPREF1024_00714 [Klebsiella sp. 4_1_44FAA]
MVITTRKPLCNKRWSASPASQDLQLTQLRHPWVATKAREGANKQVISSQADSLIKISRIWADFFPANTSNQPI